MTSASLALCNREEDVEKFASLLNQGKLASLAHRRQSADVMTVAAAPWSCEDSAVELASLPGQSALASPARIKE